MRDLKRTDTSATGARWMRKLNRREFLPAAMVVAAMKAQLETWQASVVRSLAGKDYKAG